MSSRPEEGPSSNSHDQAAPESVDVVNKDKKYQGALNSLYRKCHHHDLINILDEKVRQLAAELEEWQEDRDVWFQRREDEYQRAEKAEAELEVSREQERANMLGFGGARTAALSNLDRAEKAEAENKRLRELLGQMAHRTAWSHGFCEGWLERVRAALERGSGTVVNEPEPKGYSQTDSSPHPAPDPDRKDGELGADSD